jgi:hypothetical protein
LYVSQFFQNGGTGAWVVRSPKAQRRRDTLLNTPGGQPCSKWTQSTKAHGVITCDSWWITTRQSDNLFNLTVNEYVLQGGELVLARQNASQPEHEQLCCQLRGDSVNGSRIDPLTRGDGTARDRGGEDQLSGT